MLIPVASSGQNVVVGGGAPFADTLYAAAQSPSTSVFIERVSASDYNLQQQIGRGNYIKWKLTQLGSLPGSYTPAAHQINDVRVVIPMLVLEDTDASMAYTGAGWSTLSGTHRSNTTGDYAVFTTPSDTTCVAMDRGLATNCGYALVEVNGSATAANLCTTAQQEVDAGRLASTVLVANGGTLNPTDRVLNFHTADSSQEPRMIVDGLTAGVHSIKFTVTGYKLAASSDTRVSIDKMLYGGTSITPATSSVTDQEVFRLQTLASAFEYAYNMKSGATELFIGSVHGYEKEISFAVEVDGSPVTMSDAEVQSGSEIVCTRVTELYHSAVGGGATVVCDVTTTYTFNQDGLTVAHTDEWAQTLSPAACYPAMFPVQDFPGDIRYVDFSLGSGSDITTDEALDANDNSRISIGESAIMWMWGEGWVPGTPGRIFVASKMTNPASTLQSYAYAGTDKNFIEDRSGSSTTWLNKSYYVLMSDTLTVGDMPDVTGSTTWDSETQYRVAVVADSGAVCSQA